MSKGKWHGVDQSQIVFSMTADSSNAFEADQSHLSYFEEDEEAKGYNFLKLEGKVCNYNYGFLVEDQAFWFWPY